MPPSLPEASHHRHHQVAVDPVVAGAGEVRHRLHLGGFQEGILEEEDPEDHHHRQEEEDRTRQEDNHHLAGGCLTMTRLQHMTHSIIT